MVFIVDKQSGVPIYRQIVDQVEFMILSKAVCKGEPLPSVRDIAKKLKVNPMTVSKAYSILDVKGFVTKKPGIGLFIARPSGLDLMAQKERKLSQQIEKAISLSNQLNLTKTQFLKLTAKCFKKFKGTDGE